MRQLNKELNIQSKEEYCNDHIKKVHKNYIDDPDEYFKLKGVWNNWYDFIGLKITKFIKSKNEWIQFCKEKNINSLGRYNEACEKYKCLPKNPAEYYKDFTSIPNELGFSKKRRHII